MKKVYYVDSENVGDYWVGLLASENEDSLFRVFVTEKSPKLSYSCIGAISKYGSRVECIDCYVGENALDFQLVSCVGFELAKGGGDEIIIVSNDKGYDSVVKFWQDRGARIRRASKGTEKLKDEGAGSDSEPEILDDKAAEDEFFWDCCTVVNCIGDAKKDLLHNVFVAIFGKRQGLEAYNNMKKCADAVPSVNWKATTKRKKLLDIIFKYSEYDVEYPSDLVQIINNFLYTDEEKLIKKLVERYGNGGERLVALVKPYVKVLKSIK